MSDPDFDPYHEWLGIPPDEQPANHYRLLGLELFEADRDMIESVSLQQIAHVRTFAIGENSETSQLLLNELSAARVTLLNAVQKADYDQELRQQLSSKGLEQSSAATLLVFFLSDVTNRSYFLFTGLRQAGHRRRPQTGF